MSKSIATFLACFAVWSFAIAQSNGNAAAGRILAEKNCVYCHGPDGNGNKVSFSRGIIPHISGQPQPYFIKSLVAYKKGTRLEKCTALYQKNRTRKK